MIRSIPPRRPRELMKELDTIAAPSVQPLLTDDEYTSLRDALWRYHTHSLLLPHQCSCLLLQRINAPRTAVWSFVRRFDKPQTYKHFIRSCYMTGDGSVGSIREVEIISGLPASTSIERLEILDDENYVVSFRVLGGDHRLHNYTSVTTLHELVKDGSCCTIVLESYIVDIPEGNTKEDTCMFANTVVKCNLHSLAHLCEHLAAHQEKDKDFTAGEA